MNEADRSGATSHTIALKFVVLLGVTSLFGDMTYEGARSITGPYLRALGASGLIVGLVAGLGELIGYALRLVSGYLADRTGRYWVVTILGYLLNLFSVPLLALAGSWEGAAALMIAERVGKAIRTPARDAMLSHATREIGRGWGFGLHEALDQAGAMLGPLGVAAVLASAGSYRTAFGILLVPAFTTLAVLLAARRLYPRPRDLETGKDVPSTEGATRSMRLYLVGAALIAAGYADFALIAYHFDHRHVLSSGWIPVSYALAMGVDALAALLFGYLFDRRGLSVLVGAALLSAFFAPLVFWGGFAGAIIGMVLWGIGMGAQDSILRATVASLVPPDRRASAYGLFNAVYGVAWFVGSGLMGYLYDVSLAGLVTFSVVVQLAAIPFFMVVALSSAARGVANQPVSRSREREE